MKQITLRLTALQQHRLIFMFRLWLLHIEKKDYGRGEVKWGEEEGVGLLHHYISSVCSEKEKWDPSPGLI